MCYVEIMGCHAAFDKGVTLPLVTVWLELESTVLMIQSQEDKFRMAFLIENLKEINIVETKQSCWYGAHGGIT